MEKDVDIAPPSPLPVEEKEEKIETKLEQQEEENKADLVFEQFLQNKRNQAIKAQEATQNTRQEENIDMKFVEAEKNET